MSVSDRNPLPGNKVIAAVKPSKFQPALISLFLTKARDGKITGDFDGLDLEEIHACMVCFQAAYKAASAIEIESDEETQGPTQCEPPENSRRQADDPAPKKQKTSNYR